jgi:hypothetical protein
MLNLRARIRSHLRETLKDQPRLKQTLKAAETSLKWTPDLGPVD